MRATAVTLACVLLMIACGTTVDRPPGGEVLHASGQCGTTGKDSVITLIESQAQLGDAFARVTMLELPRRGAPVLDFKTHHALLIEMGMRPTGGFGLDLAGPPAVSSDDTLEIRVDWVEPGPDMLLTQAITSPCLLLKIPAGDYRSVVVRDRRGIIRAAL